MIAYFGAPASIDPAISYDYAGPALMRATYSHLVQLDGPSTVKIVGDLATHWTTNATNTL